MPASLAEPARAGRRTPAILTALGLVLAAGGAAAQQPAPAAPSPSTEQLRQAIDEIRRRLARPQEGQPAAQSALAAELAAANARIAELSETVARLRGEREALVAELDAARGETRRAAEAVEELEARARELEVRMNELAEARAREIEGLAAELGRERRRAAEAGAELGTATERLSHLERELERARDEAAANEKALAEAREQLGRTTRERTELETELAALVQKLGEVQGELQATRERAERDARATAGRIEELTGRLAAVEAERARAEAETSELRAIAATSVEELQRVGEELLRVLADNQALVQTLEQVRRAREQALAEAATARREAELLAAELARLRGQQKAADTETPAVEPAAAALADVQPLEAPADGLEAPVARTPLPPEQLAELRAVTRPDGSLVTVIDGNSFQFGSEQFTEAANGALLRVARLIELAAPQRILFVGHTDSQGDETVNRRLSERRARAVRDWLVRNRGLDPARTRIEGRGPDQPIASNDTPEGRRANRRVEVILEGGPHLQTVAR